MAEPLSIASGVAGIITLSSAVVAAGYKYFSSVRSAPEDLKDLIREISLLNTLISHFATQSFETGRAPRKALDALVDQAVFKDCFATLEAVQKHLDNSQLALGSTRKNAVRVLIWPLKKDDIAKGRERVERLCNLLNTANSFDNTRSLERLEKLQHTSLEHTNAVLTITHSVEERKMLDWLSTLDPRPKHAATKNLQRLGTSDWFLQRDDVADWVNHGGLLWMNGSSGTGKTVLMYVTKFPVQPYP